MSGIIQAIAPFELLLSGVITTGNSGSTFGYRTTLGSFGAMTRTVFKSLVITDMYTNAANNLIMTFSAGFPYSPFVTKLILIDSFGSGRTILTSAATVIGGSYVWAALPGGPVYAVSGQNLAYSIYG